MLFILFMYFVKLRIIPSLMLPPVMSVPPALPVIDNCGNFFLFFEINCITLLISSLFFGKITALGITLNMLASVEYSFKISSELRSSISLFSLFFDLNCVIQLSIFFMFQHQYDNTDY